jgi:hypothetical protein
MILAFSNAFRIDPHAAELAVALSLLVLTFIFGAHPAIRA